MTHSSKSSMWIRLLPRCVLPGLVLPVLVSGCSSSLGPMSWETGYRTTEVINSENPETQRMALTPNTCALPTGTNGIMTLPSGCANDLNLQYMAERPQDLLVGREMGPAQAGPVASAARERLTDREQSRIRRDRIGEEARGSTSYVTTGDM